MNLSPEVREALAKQADVDAVKPLLKLAVLGLASAAGVPMVLFLFAEGLVGLHHIWRVHRLAAGKGTPEDVEIMLRDFQHSHEKVAPERARAVLEKLRSEFGAPSGE